jgi:DNA mismatch repair protein MutS
LATTSKSPNPIYRWFHNIRVDKRWSTQNVSSLGLATFEEKVLSAADRSKQLEYEIFTGLRERIAGQAERLRNLAGGLGTLDVLCTFAEIAAKKNWKRPEVSDAYDLHITEGRHPVIETLTRSFVPNDLHLDEHASLLLLTVPNAAGKSTFARQTALLVMLAQCGSFLPVESATIGVVDRIFTRRRGGFPGARPFDFYGGDDGNGQHSPARHPA